MLMIILEQYRASLKMTSFEVEDDEHARNTLANHLAIPLDKESTNYTRFVDEWTNSIQYSQVSGRVRKFDLLLYVIEVLLVS